MAEQSSNSNGKSTAALLTDAVGHMTGLVRKEADLIKAELSESLTTVAVALGLIVGGVVFVLVALNVVSAAIVAGLTELGIEAGWAALIVGAVYLVIAAILVRKGTNDLKAASLAPTRAAQSVRQDALVLKERLHG
jgi:TRAP-type C4-dicarboxylate transport system permease small subunit